MNTPRLSNTNLKKRFFLWSTLILIGGGIALSLFSFWNSRRLLMAEAMSKSEVLLREVEAIRAYVKDELRPKMVDLHGSDTFIVEAMSTTYVSTTIMERFAQTMPNYIYRRASLNPHNPKNRADAFEEEMFDWFEQDPSRTFWQGMVNKKGESFFISMVPDYFSQPCIRCHGRVADAPASLVERYGPDGGFRFRAGEMAGINSVAIPVSAPMKKALQGSVVIFLTTLGASVLLLWLLNMLFQRLVIERLTLVLSLVAKEKRNPPGAGGDELDVLRASLRSLDRYVRSARKGSSLEPNFIGPYVVQKPVAASAMSWLYRGCRQDGTRVLLKVGFDEVLQNPLYRSCLETEYKLFEQVSHPCLPSVIERLDDVLVLEEVNGRSLYDLVQEKQMPPAQVHALFSQLLDLTASLHAAGIVHHDLRPQVLMVDDANRVKLIDMGLASQDQQPDPITIAGLGPQGEMMFMAPEQIQGRRGDPRSDIYGLGILLFFTFTGQLPYTAKYRSPQEWLRIKEQAPVTDDVREKLPDGVGRIINRAMAFDPHERYQWVEDFMEELKAVLFFFTEKIKIIPF
ncbi:putative Calcium/calmodulin-dependent protein kinase [Desulfosarcina cetonica]|uniref:c-type heme family protein n=1 Tax=Desulfosarcina cetonica TaxID=90730 RepID=UPI0006D0E3DB|nr:DUF3365 domain-containing protein [Desulfosarcina cetonica]VTR66960.1 putative Calcium/calmodulin-dependent protein kinase [Desulfosarcina cetonica]